MVDNKWIELADEYDQLRVEVDELKSLIQRANDFLSGGGYAPSVQHAAQRFDEMQVEEAFRRG